MPSSNTVKALGAILCAGLLASIARAQDVMALSAVEDAGGATAVDFNMQMLAAIEKRTVELFVTKTRAALRSQGVRDDLPRLQVDSHYVDAQGQRLAVVKIRGGKSINNVSLYGIVGTELRRVACVRTADFDQSIPLFYGPCGVKVKEVFGVDLRPR